MISVLMSVFLSSTFVKMCVRQCGLATNLYSLKVSEQYWQHSMLKSCQSVRMGRHLWKGVAVNMSQERTKKELEIIA
jgi:hypothetical protein